MNHSVKPVAVITLAAMLVILGGCAEYTSRNEFITEDFGKALASNSAMQTVNLRPAAAHNTRIKTDGTAASNAIESYRTPSASEGEAGATTASAIAPTSN